MKANLQKKSEMLFSQRAIVVKVSIPLLLLLGCVLSHSGPKTLSQHLWTFLMINIPLGAWALWSIFIPVELKSVEGQNFVTVINYRKQTQIAHEDIDFVARNISVFNTLQLKNGKRYLYIGCESNRHLLKPCR